MKLLPAKVFILSQGGVADVYSSGECCYDGIVKL